MLHSHPRPAARPGRGRGWLPILGLVVLVLVLHALALLLLDQAFAPIRTPQIPQPIFARLLVPTPPPREAPVALPHPAGRPPKRAALGVPRSGPARTATTLASASAPQPRASPAVAARVPASAPAPPASAPIVAGASAAASAPARAPQVAASTAPAASNAAGWPPSTQLRYDLTGNYRGPLHGSGSLEWIRDGQRYRVVLSGAALIYFAYTSTGHIDGNWLAPDQYVEQVFTRRKITYFHRENHTLTFTAVGTVMPLPPHLQDSASIFMQLAHELTTHPQHFRVGQHLAYEVARPSGTTTWDFTITAQDTVQTGVGPLRCWHLVHADTQQGLGAQVWLAPALDNLPVQIRLDRSADEYLLFTLRKALQE